MMDLARLSGLDDQARLPDFWSRHQMPIYMKEQDAVAFADMPGAIAALRAAFLAQASGTATVVLGVVTVAALGSLQVSHPRGLTVWDVA